MRQVIFLICLMFFSHSIAGLIKLYPSIDTAETRDPGLDTLRQLTKDDLNVLFQLISLVKKMGGVAALETLLVSAARNNYRSPVMSGHRTFMSDVYGPTVTEVTVTSPPLTLKKAPAPLTLSNLTINIQNLNIDPFSLRQED